ncbi:MAG: M23 family metallopeptidase [Candidatus Schekmanbacteria bacterium]|nr:M23 family metallopeptidase [Candidatus Schekmanbacteria bacterium]
MQLSFDLKPGNLIRAIVTLLLLILIGGCTISQYAREDEEPAYRYRRYRLKGVIHTVQKGESLWQIAKAYGIKPEYLAKVNWIKDVGQLKEGRRLFIPGAKKVLALAPIKPLPLFKEQKPLEKVEEKPQEEKPQEKKIEEQVEEKKEEKKVASLPSGKGALFAWPLIGKVSSPFGARWENKHDGIDILSPEGTEIKASAPGKVIYSDNKMRYYGNVVIIKHDGDFFTVYAHNSVNLVKEGDAVERDQVIAKVGMTGRTTAPHVHFEIRQGDQPVNPLAYLPETETLSVKSVAP